MADLRIVLVIGDAHPGPLPAEVTQINMPYGQLNAHTISKTLPDLVILPLFGPGFDAIDALAQLERFGYRGDVLVRTPALPNSRIVERELAAVVPQLRVRVTGPVS
jgi:hypothetical protein